MNNRPVLSTKTSARIDNLIKHLPHALLLSGSRGVGVESVALYIASATAQNIQVITPKKRVGTQLVRDDENGAIVIDDIRSLYEQTRSKFTSLQLFIINCGDRPMTPGAQNAFLKLLEEPQPNVHFIIATHRVELLLPTVLSRCQRVNIQPISKEQTISLLDSLTISDPTKRARIMFIAEGLPAEISRLATDETYYLQRVETVQDAKAALEGSPYDKLLIVRKYKDQRPLAIQFVDDMLLQLRGALVRSGDKQVMERINNLVSAYEKIQANGNIQLQLARVLL